MAKNRQQRETGDDNAGQVDSTAPEQATAVAETMPPTEVTPADPAIDSTAAVLQDPAATSSEPTHTQTDPTAESLETSPEVNSEATGTTPTSTLGTALARPRWSIDPTPQGAATPDRGIAIVGKGHGRTTIVAFFDSSCAGELEAAALKELLTTIDAEVDGELSGLDNVQRLVRLQTQHAAAETSVASVSLRLEQLAAEKKHIELNVPSGTAARLAEIESETAAQKVNFQTAERDRATLLSLLEVARKDAIVQARTMAPRLRTNFAQRLSAERAAAIAELQAAAQLHLNRICRAEAALFAINSTEKVCGRVIGRTNAIGPMADAVPTSV